jgi:hypothetical protein
MFHPLYTPMMCAYRFAFLKTCNASFPAWSQMISFAACLSAIYSGGNEAQLNIRSVFSRDGQTEEHRKSDGDREGYQAQIIRSFRALATASLREAT